MEPINETRQHTFSKDERLCRQKAIQSLFQHGNSFVAFPIRLIWTTVPFNLDHFEQSKYSSDIHDKVSNSGSPIKVLITVPTRTFKKAVDRNLLKRRIREAYRLNKEILYHGILGKDYCLNVGCQFIGKEIANYYEIEEKLVFAFHFLLRQLEKTV